MSASLDGYIQLAHAIVAVAAESYKYTLLAVRSHTRSDSVYRRKAELESFFSDDYVVTVSADEGTEVDLKDKLALCIRLSNDFMSDYSD